MYRAPLRSRRDDIDPQATRERAITLGRCGFGAGGDGERLARRVERFAAVEPGSFVWTREGDGVYRLGRITGPYFYDESPAAAAVDLVHVRECDWLERVFVESEVPAAVLATFARGGRNFQRTHDPDVGPLTHRLWDRG